MLRSWPGRANFQKWSCYELTQPTYWDVISISAVSNYKNTYNDKTIGQAIPIMMIVFMGALYAVSSQGNNEVSFILIGVGAITMIFWARIIKKDIADNTTRISKRETETKNWMYDLFRGESEYVFVAEVPGPEDKIRVRLIDSVLYIRGSGGFSKEVDVKGSERMQITDFQYKNGVLTLRIG